MSAEALALAGKLYFEINPQTAIASKTRYDFAAAKSHGRRQKWLDIGTNLGHGLTPNNKPGILLDIDRHFLEKQSGPRVQADGARLPIPSHSMNELTMFEVIEHLPEETAINMLKEAKRVIEPDGQVLVSTPNRGAYGTRLSSPDHIKEYDEKELQLMFASTGFVISEQYGQGFLKETSLFTKIIRFARDNQVVSWLYYHGPLFLRNKLRIGIQKAVKSEEIRLPGKNETIKNFVFVLHPK